MHYEELPLKELSLGEEVGIKNPREKIDKTGIKELASSIQEKGLLYPLLVWKVPGEKKTYKVVLEGQRRYLALQEIAKEKKKNGVTAKVPVRIVEADDATQARVTALVGNLQREALSSYEIAREIAGLKRLGLAQKDIARELGKSQSYVSRALSAYHKATDTVISAWESGKLPDDDVQHLVKLPAEEQEKRARKVLEHREKAAAIPGEARRAQAAARDTARGEPKQKPTGTPKQPKLSAEKALELAGFLEEAPKKRRYLAGVRDGVRLVLGELGPGQLAEEFQKYAKEKGLVR